MVPRCPRPDFIANVYFIILSLWANDVVLLRCLLFLFFFFFAQLSVCEGVLFCPSPFGPCGSGFAVDFFHNPIPHQFLEASRIFVLSLPTQGTVHSRWLLDVIFVCTQHSQFHVEIACNVEVFGST